MNKQIKIILIFIVTAALFSCDFFNPGDYKTAVEAYNEVDNPLYGNHWKRIYYTGVTDLSTPLPDFYGEAVADNKYYRIGGDLNDDGTNMVNPGFYRVDLSLKTIEQLALPEAASGLSIASIIFFKAVNEELFLCYTDSTNINILRFDTDSETWVSAADSDPVADADSYNVNADVFSIGSDTYFYTRYNTSKFAILKYDSGTGQFSETDTTGDLVYETENIFYTDSDLIAADNDLTSFYRYNFTTDTFSAVTVTDSRGLALLDLDTGYTGIDVFLTDSLILCRIIYDETSNGNTYSPPVLEYVDLDGDLTLRQKEFSDYTNIGPQLSSAEFRGSIYFTTHGYDADSDRDFSTNSSIFKVDPSAATMTTFSAIPGADQANFVMGNMESSELDMLVCYTSRDEIWFESFPYNYYLDPDTETWVEVAHAINFVFGWSIASFDTIYNGKYYLAGNFGPFVINNCILEYTPPVY